MSRQSHESPSNDRGEYGIGPEPTPNPHWRPLVRIRVSTLEYEPTARADGEPSWQMPIALQFLIGLVSVLACVLVFIVPYGVCFAWLLIPGFIAVARAVRDNAGWRGFVPGVLCGILLLPIAGLVLCGIIISSSGGFH